MIYSSGLYSNCRRNRENNIIYRRHYSSSKKCRESNLLMIWGENISTFNWEGEGQITPFVEFDEP